MLVVIVSPGLGVFATTGLRGGLMWASGVCKFLRKGWFVYRGVAFLSPGIYGVRGGTVSLRSIVGVIATRSSSVSVLPSTSRRSYKMVV